MSHYLSRLVCRVFGHRWRGRVCTRTACRGREDATRTAWQERLERHDAELLAFINEQYKRMEDR